MTIASPDGTGTEDAAPDGGRPHDAAADEIGFVSGQAVAGDIYDRMPYPSMPFADTQPANLAALAALFGLDAPDIGRARVLELGCGAGGNIIPLAARFPQARFTGVDLSPRHIEDGRKRVASLALANVSLVQADLTALDLAGQTFDYVICNGVFSWVPGPTQEAIFRLCRDVLAVNGVATISYNVFPGWHMRMVIRDLCLRYAAAETTVRRRVARARAALERIAATADEAEPYGLVLRTEARRLKNVPSAYILGEFLAPENTPCYVGDFIGRAAGYGLEYLCEADLQAAVPQTLDPATRGHLNSGTGPLRAGAEQHLDFLIGRLFRRSVLVRQQPNGRPPPALSGERLSALHMSSPIRLDAARSTDQLAVFTDARARSISIRDPVIGRAIARLEHAFPGTLTLDDLIAGAPTEAGAAAEIGPRIRQTVLTMVLAGRASISVQALHVGRASDERPTAWPMARVEAASGQPWLTSLRHIAVPLTPVLQALVPHLDGTHDRAALRARFIAALQAGTVQVPELHAGQPPPSQARLDAVADEYVEQTLSHVASHALLEVGGSRVQAAARS